MSAQLGGGCGPVDPAQQEAASEADAGTQQEPSGFAEACEAVRALQRGFDLEADYAGALSSMFAAKTGEEAIRVIGSRFEALHQDFGRGATDIFSRDPATTELQASEVVTYLSSRG